MNQFKITLEGKGHRPQVLTEKDKNIRAIVDAWLYMFEQAEAAQQSVKRTGDHGEDCNCDKCYNDGVLLDEYLARR
jgi:hypothetical protein